jgi:hypothetical protein
VTGENLATIFAKARTKAHRMVKKGMVTDAILELQNHAIKTTVAWERMRAENFREMVRRELHPTKAEIIAETRRLYPPRK